ncbi:MAG: SEC-C metal-binding domain-containing protein [Bacteroidales bacterium]
MKSNPIECKKYKIVFDPKEADMPYKLTDQEAKDLENTCNLTLDNNPLNIQKIQDYINTYPNVPHFRNYLSKLYMGLGELEKAFEINLKIADDFPDYIVSKMYLCARYLKKNESEKAIEILGSKLEIQNLYPNRKAFHIHEFEIYNQFVALYYLNIGDLKKADARVKFMEEFGCSKESIDMLSRQVKLYELNTLIDSGILNDENHIEVEVNSRAEKSKKKNPPTLKHPEVEKLYSFSIDIDEDVLSTILALPRESLIHDLESIVKDSIERFNYFDNLGEYEEFTLTFPFHAYMLLGDLKAEESIPTIFEFFSQHLPYYDLYFGDQFIEYLWRPIFKIFPNHLEKVKTFLLQPGVAFFPKAVFLEAIEQIAFHNPNKKKEIVNILNDVFHIYANSNIDDNIIDSEFGANLLLSIVKFEELQNPELVKELFGKGWVSESICGDFDDFMLMAGELGGERKETILSIEQLYDRINESTNYYSSEDDYLDNDSYEEFDEYLDGKEKKLDSYESLQENYEDKSSTSFDDFFNEYLPEDKKEKTRRNDPCPCGSGKKYKNCCLNADN